MKRKEFLASLIALPALPAIAKSVSEEKVCLGIAPDAIVTSSFNHDDLIEFSINKPFNEKELSRVIQSLLEKGEHPNDRIKRKLLE